MKISSKVFRYSSSCAFIAGLLLSGCGNGTNLNKIWGGRDEASDSAIMEARAAYDRGDFDAAETLAMQAYDRNNDNEEAAVLLGYIYLSRGGIDPYALARGLISATEKKDDVAALKDPKKDAKDDDDSAGSLLTTLGKIISLSDEEQASLRKSPYESDSDSTLFKENPIFIPVEVTDELRENINILKYMNKAIKITCRFVSDDAKVADEARHQDSSCARSEGPHQLAGKAHFLWAFSHLGETLVYQTALLYSSTPGETSNFESAAKSLDTGTTTIGEFADRVTDMKEAVDQVFDTTSDNSMVAAVLMDIDAVNKAFALIAGLPENITKGVSDMMTKIKSTGKEIGSADPAADTKALKGQMTEKMAGTVGKKIDAVLSDPNFVATSYDKLPADKKAEVDKVCGAFDALVIGVPEDKINRPKKCP